MKADDPISQSIDFLQKYLRINTSNPPGDVSLAAQFFSEILKKYGIEHEFFISDPNSGRMNVLARLRGDASKKPLLLINHMDVVPVELDKWSVDPFGGVLKDGYIWGRGTLDMKSTGIAQLISLLNLRHSKKALSRDVLLLCVCDEETGGDLGAKWMVDNHYQKMLPEFVIDEGGGGSRGLLSEEDKAVFAPSVNEKQIIWIRLSSSGEGGHGSMPHDNSAVEILNSALNKLLLARTSIEEAADNPIVSMMRERLGELSRNRYTNSITRNTFAVTSFQSGVGNPPKTNIIPSEASATLDCRLLPGESVDKFVGKIKKAISDDRIKLEILHKPHEFPPSSGCDTELFKLIETVIRENHPGALIAPQLLPGGTDSRFFRMKGAHAYGFEPFIIPPWQVDLIHGHDERISIEQFQDMVRILCEIVSRLAQAS